MLVPLQVPLLELLQGVVALESLCAGRRCCARGTDARLHHNMIRMIETLSQHDRDTITNTTGIPSQHDRNTIATRPKHQRHMTGTL